VKTEKQMLTYSYRIKDGNVANKLNKLARDVNFVWNYCNETSYNAIKQRRKFLTKYDFRPLTKGASKELLINSQTVQAISDEYVTRRIQFKKIKLKWRGKKSLGWVPFNGQTIKVIDDIIIYNGIKIRFWKHREIIGNIKTGTFCQDTRGRWYVNFQCEVIDKRPHGERKIGIDLGLKDKAICSDGIKYDRENLTKKYEVRLAKYQRAHKKKQVKNQRKDFSHKVSNEICSTSEIVIIGDISSSKLAKTKMAKSVLDAGWNQLTTMLQYKAIRHGMVVKKVSEKWSTQTCSYCGVIPESAPKGISALGVRNWKCSECEAIHDRDINAARNIFYFGAGRCAPTGSLSLQ
jgi:IS605 OrfB family transposase